MKISSEGSFEERLEGIRLFADEIPATLVVHDINTGRVVYMNKTGLENLGVELEEVQKLSMDQYHEKYFNSDDSADYVPKLLEIIKSKSRELVSFFQQVRSRDGKQWQLYASNVKVFHWDEHGEASHLITIASLVDPVNHITTKINRLMEEVNFLRTNGILFSRLTTREKEILKLVAMGLNSSEIAGKIFISASTAETHRRNIKRKLKLKSNFDFVRFAQAYNLV